MIFQKVARIEDATLWELGNLFSSKINSGWLTPGMAVLVALASHLAQVGTAKYCQELIGVIAHIRSILPGGCFVTAAPVTLLSGAADTVTVRSLYDTYTWLQSTATDNPRKDALPSTWECCLNIFEATGTGKKQKPHAERLSLPSKMLPDSEVPWHSEPPHSIPASLKPISRGEEGYLINIMLEELNKKLDIGLSVNIDT